MFIPLERDNILFLENVTALYSEDGKPVILRRNGKKEAAGFSPVTMKKRHIQFEKEILSACIKGKE